MQRSFVAIMALSLLGAAAAHGAGPLAFSAELTNAQEVPAPGPGLITDASISARFDNGLTQVEVRLDVSGGANVSAAHFHCARPGVPGPVVFGLFSPGPCVFDGRQARCTLTNENFSGADCTMGVGRPVNNIAALAFAMRDGLIYANVHTMDNPPGEVRGQMLER